MVTHLARTPSAYGVAMTRLRILAVIAVVLAACSDGEEATQESLPASTVVPGGAEVSTVATPPPATVTVTTEVTETTAVTETTIEPSTTIEATDSPRTTDESGDGDAYSATIRRTTDGLPHITGLSIGDVMFGEGYANGEDHACTLADQVLKVQSRRAAAFGPGEDNANINSDLAWLAIGIDERARADFATTAADTIAIFEAYAAGWNRHLADVGVDGLGGWCAGADWVQPISGADLYAYARSIALQASGARLARFIPSAQPPSPAASTPPSTAPAGLRNTQTDLTTRADGSNAWAVGADLVTGGEGGLLVGNPHFPWEGELRFWEVHLTIPGELDIYGANLIGTPGIGIGFTGEFAWSHTVSAGKRLTAYTLTLDPADPTAYLVDGVSRPMTATDHEVGVLQPDGTTSVERRTLWSSEYGPIIDFPGLGWTATTTLTYRDANVDNDEFVDQYAAMTEAQSFDEFVAAHQEHQGVPLFNTIAVSNDGRAWYADTSATPNLSAEAEDLYRERLQSDPITRVASDNGVVLLDGSDSTFVWEEVAGARDPGLVPFEEMPIVERGDYVFNANDSFWMPHATDLLDGDYSLLHGTQNTVRSLRTRANAWLLSDTGPGSAPGADGTFTGEELRDAAFANAASSARLLRQPVVERCTAQTVIDVPELAGADGTVALAAESVDISGACNVLAAWDGVYDLDSRGAVLWRELLAAVRRDAEGGLDSLWAEPFDPALPLETPAGLAPVGPAGDPVLPAMARAVQTMAKAGLAVDVALGDVQYSLRSDSRIGVHGGPGGDGLPNVVDYADPSSTSEPMPDAGARLVPGSELRPGGYPVDRGTSFVMTVDLTERTPRAWALLTYGETGDRDSPLFDVQMQRFSDKDWREVAFTEESILADPDLTEVTVTDD